MVAPETLAARGFASLDSLCELLRFPLPCFRPSPCCSRVLAFPALDDVGGIHRSDGGVVGLDRGVVASAPPHPIEERAVLRFLGLVRGFQIHGSAQGSSKPLQISTNAPRPKGPPPPRAPNRCINIHTIYYFTIKSISTLNTQLQPLYYEHFLLGYL